MRVETLIGLADQLTVKPFFAHTRFISSYEQDGLTLCVESKSQPPLTICRAEAQLLHIRVARVVQRIGAGSLQLRSELLEQACQRQNLRPHAFMQIVELRLKLIANLNYPTHHSIMAPGTYDFKSISGRKQKVPRTSKSSVATVRATDSDCGPVAGQFKIDRQVIATTGVAFTHIVIAKSGKQPRPGDPGANPERISGMFPKMDRLSQTYCCLLAGTYDCLDRIVLNAYFRLGHDAGGFRVWWRRLTGSEDTLDNAHLMRWAGGFGRRLRAWAKANSIPLKDCRAGEQKHEIGEAYLKTTTVQEGLFLILVSRAPAPVWDIHPNRRITRRTPSPT